MAVAGTFLDAAASTTGATSITTASVAWNLNDLILFTVINSHATSTGLPTATSSAGLTMVQVGTQLWDTDQKRITIFRAMGAGGTGTFTATYAAENSNGWGYTISTFSGCEILGSAGENAVRQPTFNTAANTTTPSVTLGAFGDAGNGTYGTFAHKSNGDAFTAGTGFTALGTAVGHTSPSHEVASEWRATNDTSVDGTWGGSSVLDQGFALELVADVAEAGGGVRSKLLLLGVG